MNYAELIGFMTTLGVVGGVFLAVGAMQYLQGIETKLREKWKETLTDEQIITLRKLTQRYDVFKRNR